VNPPPEPDDAGARIYADMRLALARRREMLGLSQREVGERMGQSQGTVARYEMGMRRPTFVDMHRWAAAVDMRLVQTLKPLPPRKPPR
jgi:transcriptional regulator with XRE-family HTH domain